MSHLLCQVRSPLPCSNGAAGRKQLRSGPSLLPLIRRSSNLEIVAMKILQLLLCLVVLSPVRLMADAQISEWVGQYNMNHDGHLGTLLIRDLKLDCATSPWCSLLVRYTDANGTQFAGRIERVDQNSQHMVFVIDFPGNSQKFDVYLFSWDKNKMAG